MHAIFAWRNVQALRGNPASGKFQDLEKRLRWDACYAAIPSKWICDTLYPYANDEHIDTALRAIMRELKLSTA